MSATEGHVVELRTRRGVDPEVLEAVRQHLVELLAARVLDSAVVDDEAVRLRVATVSRITALAASWAGVQALGCEDLFLRVGPGRGADALDARRVGPLLRSR